MGKKSKRRGIKRRGVTKITTADDTHSDAYLNERLMELYSDLQQGIDELAITNNNEKPPSDGVARIGDTAATKFADVSTPLNEKMKDIVDELFQSEISWLKSLPSGVKEKLMPNWNANMGWPAPINHICVTGEIALVLSGTKPCSVVGHGTYQPYGRLYYEKILRPWYDKYFKEDSGFVCELSMPGVAYYVIDSKGNTVDFGENAIFRNTRHPISDLAEEVFSRTDRPVTMEELRVCFGFPSNYDIRTDSDIVYQFQNPEELFNIGQVCCSPCLDYVSREADAAAVGRHFREYQKAMKALGYSIALDIDNQSLWSDEAIATAWYEAAGRDYDEFERMIRADELWMRREGHREISIIFSLVFAM